jgi:UTP--glucose-1-phosphate uridylyltransferase
VVPSGCRCVYIRQAEPLGLGHAVLCAQPAIGDEAFAVILADDLISADPPVIAQMTSLHGREGCSILGVEDVPRDQTAAYGIVSPEESDSGVTRIGAIVEKPAPAEAPSTLAVVGRYILTPRIFHFLAAGKPGRGGEIQLTDAISALLAEERVLAYRFSGNRYDCGSKIGYLKATVELGLRHQEVGAEFAAFLAGRSPDA